MIVSNTVNLFRNKHIQLYLIGNNIIVLKIWITFWIRRDDGLGSQKPWNRKRQILLHLSHKQLRTRVLGSNLKLPSLSLISRSLFLFSSVCSTVYCVLFLGIGSHVTYNSGGLYTCPPCMLCVFRMLPRVSGFDVDF